MSQQTGAAESTNPATARPLAGRAVAVTGASGFIGRYIVRELLRAGARVVGVVRDPTRAADLTDAGVELRIADLARPAELERAFAGVDAVVSNAALVTASADPHMVVEQNLGGVRNLLEAMAAAGVRRCVEISSAGAYARLFAGEPIGESAPLRTRGRRLNRVNAYVVSKALSERLAWELAAINGIGLTTLRAFAVYGAFDRRTFLYWFSRLMALGVAPYPAFSSIAMVYAGEVGDAVVRMLARPAALGRAYNITGDDRSLWEFLDAWRAAGGRVPRLLVPLPLPLTVRFDLSAAAADLDWHPGSFFAGCQEIVRDTARGSLFETGSPVPGYP